MKLIIVAAVAYILGFNTKGHIVVNIRYVKNEDDLEAIAEQLS